MTAVTCDIRDCKELAPYKCINCEGDFCEEHVIAGTYWVKDADDYGFTVDENGDEHYCLGCLE